MYIESIYISRNDWRRPKEGEEIEYRGKIKFSDGEQGFTFVLDDESTRLVTLCCMDRVKESADSFTEKIRSMIEPKKPKKENDKKKLITK